VRAHGFARPRDRLLEARPLVGRELAEVRHHQFVDQAEDARVLLDRGLGVDGRHARRVQVVAHLLQQPRQKVEPGLQ
jgi:hypothetical protein